MFVDVEIHENPMMRALAVVIGGGDDVRRLGVGQYEIDHFSFNHMLPKKAWDEYSDVGDFGAYGVCDSPAQFMATAGLDLEASPDAFVVSFTRIAKADQPSDGGWRWHKWGPYIGEKTPTTEYIHDEPAIDEVYVYHFFRRLRPGEKPRW